MEWMLMPYRRYADFSGRSRRKEYWMFMLFTIIVYVVCFALIAAGGALSGLDPATGAPQFGVLAWVGFGLLGIFALGSFIPALACQIRRFHDQDKSGWFWLLAFIPYAGSVILIVFMCIEGTKGENRFGQDPKGIQNLGEVFS
jgi:uncharacterized membrane protein YhaH (DUF805 family)